MNENTNTSNSPIESELSIDNSAFNQTVILPNNSHQIIDNSDSDFEKTIKKLKKDVKNSHKSFKNLQKSIKISPEKSENFNFSNSSDPCEIVDDCANSSKNPQKPVSPSRAQKAEIAVFSDASLEENLINDEDNENESSDSQFYFSRKRRKDEFLTANSVKTKWKKEKKGENEKILTKKIGEIGDKSTKI